ncbi:hypothetical protein [Caballeronia ptereochthonis]|uniref:Lipoprotein n=1 Tax=Caballeronia ptereochthonis TaxID=1777144 RepID=A0A158E6N7_9BURK|nr:hypothetical protein [Caballeronia ptereochthonis]SAL02545.1 hypothetical protein AWB83_06620 [Caballeronia ptereochthonis]
MKASTLLAQGALIALASTSAMSQAQPPPAASDFHVSTKATMATPQNNARSRDATPPAPRGDLRGDIASNVRTRPEPDRESRSQHH